jgi:hypothetical protein
MLEVLCCVCLFFGAGMFPFTGFFLSTTHHTVPTVQYVD